MLICSESLLCFRAIASTFAPLLSFSRKMPNCLYLIPISVAMENLFVFPGNFKSWIRSGVSPVSIIRRWYGAYACLILCTISLHYMCIVLVCQFIIVHVLMCMVSVCMISVCVCVCMCCACVCVRYIQVHCSTAANPCIATCT